MNVFEFKDISLNEINKYVMIMIIKYMTLLKKSLFKIKHKYEIEIHSKSK